MARRSTWKVWARGVVAAGEPANPLRAGARRRWRPPPECTAPESKGVGAGRRAIYNEPPAGNDWRHLMLCLLQQGETVEVLQVWFRSGECSLAGLASSLQREAEAISRPFAMDVGLEPTNEQQRPSPSSRSIEHTSTSLAGNLTPSQENGAV